MGVSCIILARPIKGGNSELFYIFDSVSKDTSEKDLAAIVKKYYMVDLDKDWVILEKVFM